MNLRFGRAGIFSVAIALSSGPGAEAQQAVPLHVVRVGYGDVGGLRDSIVRNVDACRVLNHLPPGGASPPPDAYLAKLEVMREEEFFDGQMWAEYVTQKQVNADASSGCSLTVFAVRLATVERACESRISGNTVPLGELTDFQTPSTAGPEVFEEALPSQKCREKPVIYDLAGLPREDAGAARCVWNSQIIGKKMAALGMDVDAGGPGHDICLYEAIPMYNFQGTGHAVVLKSRTIEDAAGNNQNSTLGDTKAFGNLELKSFSSGTAIDRAKFGRAAVDAFLNLPAKSSL